MISEIEFYFKGGSLKYEIVSDTVGKSHVLFEPSDKIHTIFAMNVQNTFVREGRNFSFLKPVFKLHYRFIHTIIHYN